MEELLFIPVLLILIYFAYKACKQDMHEVQNSLDTKVKKKKIVKPPSLPTLVTEEEDPPSYASVVKFI